VERKGGLCEESLGEDEESSSSPASGEGLVPSLQPSRLNRWHFEDAIRYLFWCLIQGNKSVA